MRVSRLGCLVVPTTLGCSDLLGADFDDAQVPPPYEVSVVMPAHPSDAKGATPTSTGGGTVTSSDESIVCGTRCTERMDHRTLTLIAEPAEGSAFAGWRTDPPTACSGTIGPECSIEVASDVRVEAYFVTNG